MTSELRKKIASMVYKAKDGHIPSAFSIVDILDVLYGNYLKYDAKNPQSAERDYFVLSKGHGCVAFYTILHKYGFIGDRDIETFCTSAGILGEHPDCTKVPGVEASTGSLGHGLPFAVGIALALKIRQLSNKIFVLVGDGECHEGTVWESANVAHNLNLNNMCVIVDWNGSAAQLMPKDALEQKWTAFGWNTIVANGHDSVELHAAFKSFLSANSERPTVILAKTVKGKGVPMLEGHGNWHHRIPSSEEFQVIMESLS